MSWDPVPPHMAIHRPASRPRDIAGLAHGRSPKRGEFATGAGRIPLASLLNLPVTMKTTCLIAGLAALALATPPIVSAQTQTPQTGAPISIADVKKALGAPETVTATVAAVDFDERIVVLRTEAGMDRAMYVGSEVSRFKNIKVGDRVTITYYMSLATALLQPGEAPGASAAGAVTTTPGVRSPVGLWRSRCDGW